MKMKNPLNHKRLSKFRFFVYYIVLLLTILDQLAFLHYNSTKEYLFFKDLHLIFLWFLPKAVCDAFKVQASFVGSCSLVFFQLELQIFCWTLN